MSIIRQKRNNQFAIIPNEMLTDSRLRWKTRGLLAYMLSKPDNWEFRIKELVQHSDQDGVEAVKSALKEMEKYGYLVRVSRRLANGTFAGVDMILVDIPEKTTAETGGQEYELSATN